MTYRSAKARRQAKLWDGGEWRTRHQSRQARPHQSGDRNPDSITSASELKRNMFRRQWKLECRPPYTPFAALSNSTFFENFVDAGLFQAEV